MHKFRLGGYFCSILAVIVLLYACADPVIQRKKAETISRKWISRNSEKIATLISEAVIEKLPVAIKEEVMLRHAGESLNYLHIYINPAQASFPQRAGGPWITIFQSGFKISDIWVSYHLIVSSRLGLISSVEEVRLQDIAP